MGTGRRLRHGRQKVQATYPPSRSPVLSILVPHAQFPSMKYPAPSEMCHQGKPCPEGNQGHRHGAARTGQCHRGLARQQHAPQASWSQQTLRNRKSLKTSAVILLKLYITHISSSSLCILELKDRHCFPRRCHSESHLTLALPGMSRAAGTGTQSTDTLQRHGDKRTVAHWA